MPAGRPSDYTPQLATAICAQIADGKSLRSVCRADEMPDKSTVFDWLAKHPSFADQYARAKEESAESHAEDILDIADDSALDFIQTESGPVFNAEHVQRSRLRVDTRKWIASKLKAKKYGDKLEHTGDVTLSLSDRMRGALGSTKAE